MAMIRIEIMNLLDWFRNRKGKQVKKDGRATIHIQDDSHAEALFRSQRTTGSRYSDIEESTSSSYEPSISTNSLFDIPSNDSWPSSSSDSSSSNDNSSSFDGFGGGSTDGGGGGGDW